MDGLLAQLEPYLGTEHTLDNHNQVLRRVVQALRPAVVGALRITCADESERECIDSFQRYFVQPLLPTLKFWSKSPFRLANLGGRYQEGAVQIAEDHFALPISQDSFKVLLVKVNSHVAVGNLGGRYGYGRLSRYQSESLFCGALHAVLAGSTVGFAEDLRLDFSHSGVDRLSLIQDQGRSDPGSEGLVAAIVNARIQALRAVEEIATMTPRTPTLFLVAAAVTLNKQDHDGELFCGLHLIDRRTDAHRSVYRGVPDRPPFLIDHRFGQLRVGF